MLSHLSYRKTFHNYAETHKENNTNKCDRRIIVSIIEKKNIFIYIFKRKIICTLVMISKCESSHKNIALIGESLIVLIIKVYQ